ncbi:ATP dependent DNA ligase domain-containing protein [Mrakia frigida]|uniref:ATP dependent DNA ligase domain-containing protein n=1 Tax=Mrakia frigida TaxID=29902 RepID=UPI003FCBFD98
MSKQSTLFKHISGVKPLPDQQSTLDKAMFKKKEAKEKKEEGAQEDVEMVEVEEEDSPIKKKTKKRIAQVDSDEDEEDELKPSASSSSKPKPTASPSSSSSKPAAVHPFFTAPSPVKPKPKIQPRPSFKTKNPKKSSSTTADAEADDLPPPAKKKKVVDEEEEEEEEEEMEVKKGGKGKLVSKSQKKREQEEEELENASGSGGEEELDGDEEESEESEVEEAVAKKAASTIAKLATKKAMQATTDYPVWTTSQAVPYAALVKCFTKIESTSSRLEIISYLTQFLLLVIQRAGPAAAEGGEKDAKGKGKEKETKTKDGLGAAENVLKVVYLSINRLCPDYVGLELGLGEALLVKAIAESTGRLPAKIKADYKKEGDLGLVAMISRKSQPTLWKPTPLTVPFVFNKVTEIAKTSGQNSTTRKIGIINRLFSASEGEEAKFLIRSLEGKLRIRLAEKSVIVALANAVVLSRNADKNLSPEKMQTLLTQGVEIVKQVYSELPNLDLIIPALLRVGVEGLHNECKLTPGVPLKPMLAKPTKAITEVLDRFEGKKFTCEYKYDGERAQIHREANGTFTVFSRNSENMSVKYPDLMVQLPRCMKGDTRDFVLDCEAVAWDPVEKKLLPFQELSRRKRKDVKIEDIKVKVLLFAFDILYLNGEPLLQKQLHERRKLLHDHFVEVEGEFAFAKSSDGETSDEIQAFLEESVKDSCEGLMVKMLETEDSTYEPSRRSMNWLKLKKDYLSGIGDSLDLVVVGAYNGRGKRTKVYGAFLLACFDPDTEQFQTICKIGTGFSDEILESHYEALKGLETPSGPRKDIQVGGANPDVWFKPEIVWEVLTADLSLSPIYTAAKGLAGERGISLRFPRFLRVRDDKDADQATSGEQIAEMYEAQAVVSNGKKGGAAGGGDGFW